MVSVKGCKDVELRVNAFEAATNIGELLQRQLRALAFLFAGEEIVEHDACEVGCRASEFQDLLGLAVRMESA